LVRGRLEIGEWTTREGEQRTSYDIWADDVVNLTARDTAPREDAPRQEPAAAPAAASSRPAARRQPATASDESLDDLPF
jgi:single-stranded DNA-binding protein